MAARQGEHVRAPGTARSPHRAGGDHTPLRPGVAIEQGLLSHVEALAAARGISAETLVNLWLQEQVHAVTPPNWGQRGYG